MLDSAMQIGQKAKSVGFMADGDRFRAPPAGPGFPNANAIPATLEGLIPHNVFYQLISSTTLRHRI